MWKWINTITVEVKNRSRTSLCMKNRLSTIFTLTRAAAWWLFATNTVVDLTRQTSSNELLQHKQDNEKKCQVRSSALFSALSLMEMVVISLIAYLCDDRIIIGKHSILWQVGQIENVLEGSSSESDDNEWYSSMMVFLAAAENALFCRRRAATTTRTPYCIFPRLSSWFNTKIYALTLNF